MPVIRKWSYAGVCVTRAAAAVGKRSSVIRKRLCTGVWMAHAAAAAWGFRWRGLASCAVMRMYSCAGVCMTLPVATA